MKENERNGFKKGTQRCRTWIASTVSVFLLVGVSVVYAWSTPMLTSRDNTLQAGGYTPVLYYCIGDVGDESSFIAVPEAAESKTVTAAAGSKVTVQLENAVEVETSGVAFQYTLAATDDNGNNVDLTLLPLSEEQEPNTIRPGEKVGYTFTMPASGNATLALTHGFKGAHADVSTKVTYIFVAAVANGEGSNNNTESPASPAKSPTDSMSQAASANSSVENSQTGSVASSGTTESETSGDESASSLSTSQTQSGQENSLSSSGETS